MFRQRSVLSVVAVFGIIVLAWWAYNLTPSLLGFSIQTGQLDSYLKPQEYESLGLPKASSTRYLASLELEALSQGCPIIDCISAIDKPDFEAVDQADHWLRDDDWVMGVRFQGIAKAYPIKILNWHELVNDVFDEVAVLVSYCPLCHAGVVFERPHYEKVPLQFGVSGRLYRSDLVMFDRATGTFWSQVTGQAIIGPLAGTSLKRVPTDLMPWHIWKALYPKSQVLARPTFQTPMAGHLGGMDTPPSGLMQSRGRYFYDYNEDPYPSYQADAKDTFGTPFSDERLSPKAEVLGVIVQDQAKAYPLSIFSDQGTLHDNVGNEPIVLAWQDGWVRVFRGRIDKYLLSLVWQGQGIKDQETETIWSLTGKGIDGPLAERALQSLEVLRGYWFAWLSFHPNTQLFEQNNQNGRMK